MKSQILNHYLELTLEKASAIALDPAYSTEMLLAAADEIRQAHVGNKTSLCTIVNGKSGKCTEDCRFCAQSKYYVTEVQTYPLLSSDEILEAAFNAEKSGVQKFSIVTSGGYLTDMLLDALTPIYMRLVRETDLKICASHGMLTPLQAKRLKAAGVSKYHHNLETSRSYYPEICKSHDYQERIQTIKACHEVGLEVCCGGIFGLGEEMSDRIALAYEIKALGITSIPINILMPIEGTPLAMNTSLEIDQILRSLAMFRIICPYAVIRIAGGRAKLGNDIKSAFTGGVNALMVGNYLTTLGSKVEDDLLMMKELGYVLD